MSHIVELDAPDDEVRRSWGAATARRWRRGVRGWWFGLAYAVVSALIATVAPPVFSLYWAQMAVLAAFSAGYFYNERLRELGRESRFRSLRPPR